MAVQAAATWAATLLLARRARHWSDCPQRLYCGPRQNRRPQHEAISRSPLARDGKRLGPGGSYRNRHAFRVRLPDALRSRERLPRPDDEEAAPAVDHPRI